MLREYIVSEAMHTLGIPTTRALAAVTTGEKVMRESFLQGAILTRVASSHIRIGTFQFFAARRDTEALELLVEHVLARHYPQADTGGNPALALLDQMVSAQASLVAKWQLLGFIHGVMNTDNMLLSGDTIDYGPCAFMDDFDPARVFSSIDHAGRYAYGNQPGIAHWNLAALAQALLPILHDDQEQAVALAQGVVDTFPHRFASAHRAGLARKLGVAELRETDQSLADELFDTMAQYQLDFTLTFRRLADLAGAGEDDGDGTVAQLFEVPDPLLPWLARWRERLAQEASSAAERQALMYVANPIFIPRNHLVEEALVAASDERFDGSEVERVTGHHDQMACPGLEILIGDRDVLGALLAQRDLDGSQALVQDRSQALAIEPQALLGFEHLVRYPLAGGDLAAKTGAARRKRSLNGRQRLLKERGRIRDEDGRGDGFGEGGLVHRAGPLKRAHVAARNRFLAVASEYSAV